MLYLSYIQVIFKLYSSYSSYCYIQVLSAFNLIVSQLQNNYKSTKVRRTIKTSEVKHSIKLESIKERKKVLVQINGVASKLCR